MKSSNAVQISPEDRDAAQQRQHGGEAQQAESQATVATHVGGRGAAFNGANGSAQTRNRVASVNMADRTNTGSIFDTAQHNGSPVEPSRLTSNSTIDVGGIRTTLKVAERMGIVTRGPDGRYHEVGRSPAPVAEPKASDEGTARPAEKQQSMPAQTSGEALAAEPEAMLQGIRSKATPTAVNDAIGNVMTAATRGTEVDLSELADHLGMSNEQAAKTHAMLRDAFQEQADTAAKSAGVTDLEAFWRWCRTAQTGKLRVAVLQQIDKRSSAAYRALAQEYVRTAPGALDPDSFLDGDHGPGVEVFKREGKVMVRARGQTMELRAAIRSGLVAPR